MTDPIKIRIGLPLEVPVASTVLTTLSLVYPNAVMGGSDDHDASEMVLLIDPADRDADPMDRLVEALKGSLRECTNWSNDWGDDCMAIDSEIDLRILAETLIEKLSVRNPGQNSPQEGAIE